MKRKILTFVTLGFFCLLLILLNIFSTISSSQTFPLDSKGSITLGWHKASVKMILFEDFRCSHCRQFISEIFPKIKSEYIDTGHVHCTIVPLVLFPGAKILSNAALEIYFQNPEGVFEFLEKAIPLDKIKKKKLLNIAETIPGIDVELLEECLKNSCHEKGLDQNLKIATKAMKNDLRVPMLYVNGEMSSTRSYEEIAEKFNKYLIK